MNPGDTNELDELNWNILQALQENARLSFAELGRRVGLSAPAVSERVRKMEEAGIITGYHVGLDLEKVGLPITAFIRMSLSGVRASKIIAQAAKLSEVRECHRATGSDCIIMKVRASSIAHLEALTDRFVPYGQITTSIVFSSPVTEHTVGPQTVQNPQDFD